MSVARLMHFCRKLGGNPEFDLDEKELMSLDIEPRKLLENWDELIGILRKLRSDIVGVVLLGELGAHLEYLPYYNAARFFLEAKFPLVDMDHLSRLEDLESSFIEHMKKRVDPKLGAAPIWEIAEKNRKGLVVKEEVAIIIDFHEVIQEEGGKHYFYIDKYFMGVDIDKRYLKEMKDIVEAVLEFRDKFTRTIDEWLKTALNTAQQ